MENDESSKARAARYRGMADEAANLAAESSSSAVRDQCLKMIDIWRALADEAEHQDEGST